MTRFVKATYHADLKVAEFIADDGRHLLRFGGTLPWRLNNSGDLVSPQADGQPAPKKTRNFIGFATLGGQTGKPRHLFIFPDYETGRAELLASIKRLHSEHCIEEIVKSYAPAHDNNDTDAYARRLLKATGIADDKKVGSFTDAEMNDLLDGIEKLEGYHNEAASRKEMWVPVTRITATDGARPIADEQIVLLMNGEQTVLKSNHVGQFPLIPHHGEPIEVHQKGVDGTLKKIGEVSGGKGNSLSLLSTVQRFLGHTKPDAPPESSTGGQRRHPLRYQVQPGDSLSKIAAKFDTSVEKLKADNHLKTDKIFPGDLLGVNGSLQPLGPVMVKPKKSASVTVSTFPAAAGVAGKPQPSATEIAVPARSNGGTGAPLALIHADGKRAPWMAFAMDQARKFKGASEAEIEKTVNYAKEVRTGQSTIVGNNHPWCAAFVNWCLMKAGYPVDNPEFADHVAAKGRAHGFYEVEGKKANKKDPRGPIVRNPLFVKIDEPIYGAIAVVTNAHGHGHHVGFVYARVDAGKVVMLGGNQSDQINFTDVSVNAVPSKTVVDKSGKKFTIKGSADHLMFFVPAAYAAQATKDIKSNDLPTNTAEKLNEEFEIQVAKKNGDVTR